MKMRDVTGFLQEVLEDLDDLPEGFENRLIEVANSTSIPRKDGIRELIVEVARG